MCLDNFSDFFFIKKKFLNIIIDHPVPHMSNRKFYDAKILIYIPYISHVHNHKQLPPINPSDIDNRILYIVGNNSQFIFIVVA